MAIDWDNVFKYAAPKYVYIRDAKLGIMKYLFMGAIFGYVIGYQIYYSCAHLKPHLATGFGTMTLAEPSMECGSFDTSCEPNFDTIYGLDYCAQYKGGKLQPSVTQSPAEAAKAAEAAAATKATVAPLTAAERRLADKEDKDSESADDGPKVGDKITKQRNCRYVDNLRLTWEPGVMSELFIPTRFKQVKQTLNPGCYDPEATSHAVGHDKYDCAKSYNTEVISDYFVADIGEFHVTLEHTFNCPTLGEFGNSGSIQGFFAACKTNAPLTSRQVKSQCKRMKVPESEGAVAPEDEVGLLNASAAGVPSLRGINGRDVISLRDLLKLTPVAQDNGFVEDILDRKFPDKFGHPKESLREKGGILMLDVNYDNTAYMRPGFGPWPVKPITYTYRPSFVPTAENYKYQLVEKHGTSDTRVVDIWYGISIRMTFNGELVKFQFHAFLTALTAGLVLLSSASTLVLYLAAYVLPCAEKYCLLLYQLSEDFSDYVQLTRTMSEDNIKPQSMYWVGKLLLRKLQELKAIDEGKTPKQSGAGPKDDGILTPAEINAILVTTEMRLNRLDGMDPPMVFDDGREMDLRNYKIGDKYRAFYQNFPVKKEDIATMSYKAQDIDRQDIPSKGSDPNKFGVLKSKTA